MPRVPPTFRRPNSITTPSIQKCTTTTSLRKARQLHALLITNPVPTSPFQHNNVLSIYLRCGSIADAQQMLERMPQRNVVSYNTLISAYSRTYEHEHLAFRLLDQLGCEGLKPSASTVTSLLQACSGLGDFIMGCSLHGHCVKNGFLDNVHVQTSLLGMYWSCGEGGCAQKVFSEMSDRDDTAWNSMISGCVRSGRASQSLKLFKYMRAGDVEPTQITYSLLLNACAKLEDYDSGRLIHALVLVSGTCIDLPLQNAMLDMYCSCSDTETAFDVFMRIENPDLISWNSMINGFSEKGEGENAMNLFVKFRRIVTSIKPDEYTYAAVISGISEFPACSYGKPLHAQVEKTGYTKSVYVGSTLLSMYFNNEDCTSTQMIFDSFPDKDVVLWTGMISGHVRVGETEAALRFFQEMTKQGFNLDRFALSSALSACADLVTVTQGETIHGLALKTGNDAEACVHGSLVDMYTKNGEHKAATSVFLGLTKRDMKCWNSMLTGLGHHGKAREAFQMFYKMLKQGFVPDQVTFLSLLTACSHCGLVQKCKYFWKHMKESGLKPGPKHYSCMINSLSRAGMWDEAEEMIIESPFKDSYLESWRTVLSSCIKNDNLEVGIRAAEQILNIDAEDSGASVLLMKLYASSGKWREVKDMRRKMRRLSVEKEPGLSWIEVRSCIHAFSSGDLSHRQCCEVRDELTRLIANLMTPCDTEDVFSTC